ncbi:hypothetical protein ABDK56_00925 [Sphingomonas sp. ASV193]|uniref:hypothetical protein n=1 Tax=Sphingomonas sp. ASV193 TaxID=3144405 RepID=UPI0032E8A2FA
MISLILMASAAQASFDCQLEAPKAIGFDGEKVTASTIGLPPATLAFALTISDGNPKQATITWAEDPMKMAGTFPAIETAPNSYAFSSFSGGPCMFTEKACLTQFNLVGARDGSAFLVVTPVALTRDQKSGGREPFAVLARGVCQRRSAGK